MARKKNTERFLIIVAIALFGIMSIADVVEDYLDGESILRSIFDDDVLVSAVVIGVLLYMWKLQPVTKQIENIKLKRLVKNSRSDLQHWKSKASILLKGLGEKINHQFDDWGLSNAEKEVALLLIKGMSFKEIGLIRETNEKTVRQQASSIYSKGNIDNRAELSAFFLEDLLLPEQILDGKQPANIGKI